MKLYVLGVALTLFLVNQLSVASAGDTSKSERSIYGTVTYDWLDGDISELDHIIIHMDPQASKDGRVELAKLIDHLVIVGWLKDVVLDSIGIGTPLDNFLEEMNQSERTRSRARQYSQMLQGDEFLLFSVARDLYMKGISIHAGNNSLWAKAVLDPKEQKLEGMKLLMAMGSIKNEDFSRLYPSEASKEARMQLLRSVLGITAFQTVIDDMGAVSVHDHSDGSALDRKLNSHFEIPEAMAWKAKNTGSLVVTSRLNYAHKHKGIVPYLKKLRHSSSQVVVTISDQKESADLDGIDIFLPIR